MKKCLLFNLALGMSSVMLAQSINVPSAVTPAKLKASVANKAVFYKKNQLQGAEATPSFTALAEAPKLKPYQLSPGLKAYTTTVIGNTGYQLQTNAAICNRVVTAIDGTIGATWTMSQVNDGAWADRGTGYNFYNGTSWGASPTVRVEAVRTGFTNLGWGTPAGEYVVTHEASNIHVASRAAKGTGTWSDAALGFPDVWSRLAVGGTGTSLHIISQTTGTANPPYFGQDGALAYTRSQDGGVTWDLVRSVIPAIDSNFYVGFGGDSYSIDARGNNIAIVVGGFEVDVVLIKSSDNGTTWTKTIVDPFPLPMFDEASMLSDVDGDGVADTIQTNDASVHVLLDNSNNAHVWFGNMRMLNDVMGDGGVSYFPGTDGLMYWNEGMGASAPVMIAAAEDIDGDGILNVVDWGTYQVSFASLPSAGIASDGKIYVSYSGMYEGQAEGGAPGVGKSYRHTYVMRSDDGGVTWCEPHDVTDPGDVIGLQEGVYGAMAKKVDTHVHLVVQQDGSVGHGVTPSTPDPQSGLADMIYTKIPVADLACGVGINESTQNSIVTELFPNPATNTATLVITSTERNQATVKVYNSIGKLVSQSSNELPNAGTHRINLNLEKFNRGIYFVNVTVNGRTATEKLIVE